MNVQISFLASKQISGVILRKEQNRIGVVRLQLEYETEVQTYTSNACLSPFQRDCN